MPDASSTIRGLGPEPTEALILLPDRNTLDEKTQKMRGDWSGAFLPEAVRFGRLHKAPPERLVKIDISRDRAARLQQVLAAVERCGSISLLAFFCHGWRGGLQLGPYSQDVAALVRVLGPRARHDLAVVLYACSAGGGTEDGPEGPGGEGGFADALRDALVREGLPAQVDAHTCVGHTCRNPYVRRFSRDTATGGAWLVAPDDPLWKTWRARMHDTDLRHRFPLLTPEQIRQELAAPP